MEIPVDFLAKLDITNLVTMTAIVWLFYKRIDHKFERVDQRFEKMKQQNQERFTKIDGQLPIRNC